MDKGFKTFLAEIEFKAEDEGKFTAKLATLDVIDHDQDVISPGAMTAGGKILLSTFNHASAHGPSLPVGFAVIREEKGSALADGEFNLDTILGRETFAALKFNQEHGVKQEWSFAYFTKKVSFGQRDNQNVRFLEELDVFEISPVIRGAGIETNTIAMKSNQSYQDHAEAVLAAISDLVVRTKALAALRAKDGRVLSKANLDRMEEIQDELAELDQDFTAVREAAEAPSESDGAADEDQGKALLLQYQKIRAGLISQLTGGKS